MAFFSYFLGEKWSNRWSVFNSDYILGWADQIYRSAGNYVALEIDDLPLRFNLTSESDTVSEMLSQESSLFEILSVKDLSLNSKDHGLI